MEAAGLNIGAENVDPGDAPENEKVNRKRTRGESLSPPAVVGMRLWLIVARRSRRIEEKNVKPPRKRLSRR
jgi:hypothetical protein